MFYSKILPNSTVSRVDYIVKECVGSSTIRYCAIGAFQFECIRIIAGHVTKSSKLENNVVFDSQNGMSNDNFNGVGSKSLSAALFTQHYFEHNLGWDFTDVWQWNGTRNHPELRAVGVNAARHQLLTTDSQGNMVDRLQQQLKSNIWL